MFESDWWKHCLDHVQVRRALTIEALIPGKFTEKLEGFEFECYLVLSSQYPTEVGHLRGLVERHDDFADRCVCIRRLDLKLPSTLEIGSGLVKTMEPLRNGNEIVPGEFRGDLRVSRKPIWRIVLGVGEECIVPPGEPHVFYGRLGGAVYLVAKEPVRPVITRQKTTTASA